MIRITDNTLTINELGDIFNSGGKLELDDSVVNRIEKSHSFLKSKVTQSDLAFYGINTGFGSLCNVKIEEDELAELQRNLIRSHACGIGDRVPDDLVRLMLLLKILGLSKGYSGVSIGLVQRLIDFYNHGVLPVVYQLGSLGASGDLAPLAHLSLPLIGEGEVSFHGQIRSSSDVLEELGLEPLVLRPKEGLALINGTQFSCAYAVHGVWKSTRLMDNALEIIALSFDAYNCNREPLSSGIHRIRNQKGQKTVAAQLLSILDGSDFSNQTSGDVQDPYSFRCVPQVLGASLDALDHAIGVVENEVNGVTDNPNIFAEDDQILVGGNFHAQPLALVMDYLAIAMSEVASISERRVFKLVSGYRSLPDYLTRNAGLQSGFMILQYTAASIVSQNKQLCTPASVDSITSSKGQEDHVSMAANSGTKLYRVLDNVERVLAIEYLCAAEALEFRRPTRSSEQVETIHAQYRLKVGRLEGDRAFYRDIQDTIDFWRNR